jgi:NDP-sugar pyrophosphorylase family protein
MNKLSRKPLRQLGYHFIEAPYLRAGQDEYYIRDQQFVRGNNYRRLSSGEIEALVKNENVADSWDDILVSEAFDANLVRNCRFYGRVRIGALEPYFLEYHELKMPVGLYNSTIISCDIGDHVAIKNVQYLAYYIIGNEVLLFNVNEMQTTDHAKFGNGILKEGEPESLRIWLELSNENGRRKVLPFADMLPADAYLWSKFRDDTVLMEAFVRMTDREYDTRRGYYGTIGDQCVIKNTQSIKDVKMGSHAYIKGANKLKNLTIKSSAEAPSQIGEGVELVNGVMGYGSRAFYGVKAVRFILGENSTLKYGARLINSMLGDNSTISCCEVLNSLIFPGHEQHHNNSFLIAATVLGQSNIAAGATIGSNHNSRGADGEVIAGRGFWPGLCVSLKHNSRFASFCLLAKGDFPAELNISLPFALVINNEGDNALDIIPAFWWLYNMYALARNAWKYQDRDRRTYKLQSFESDFLAPDTVAEIFAAMRLLERATETAYLRQVPDTNSEDMEEGMLGRKLLQQDHRALTYLEIVADGMEHSSRPVRLLKVKAAYDAYYRMLHYYGVKTLLQYGKSQHQFRWPQLQDTFSGSRRVRWTNLGGQLIPYSDLEKLKEGVRSKEIDSWRSVHEAYKKMDRTYEWNNAANAYATLLELHQVGEQEVDQHLWRYWLQEAVSVAQEIAAKTRQSRAKDYSNPFRQITYESQAEMEAVLGTVDDDQFVAQMEAEALRFEELVKEFRD